jgi:NADH dehydrogenase
LAAVSRSYAVASIGRLRVAGFFAWLLWLAVHLMYLVGFKNRFTTVLDWAVAFIGRGRSERTVISKEVLARNARPRPAPPAGAAPTASQEARTPPR